MRSVRMSGGCPADFNLSGGLEIQDIFDFLAAYFAHDPAADVNFVLHNSGGLSASFVRSKPPGANVGFQALTTLPEGSTLAPGGSRYESLHSAPLAGNA